MNTDKRISAFVELGGFLKAFEAQSATYQKQGKYAELLSGLDELLHRACILNPWFTVENSRDALAAIAENLRQDTLLEWLSFYIKKLEPSAPKKVAVIMAGNIPLVGFHDMLCVLISGNKFIGKLSSEDKLLVPYLAKVLISIEPEFDSFIEFTDGRLGEMDAVIATGSNNSARYFDHYFGKYPHIIRRNRNSVAVLTGNESPAELKMLGEDVFRYFGLGCRNVSKLFVPLNYDFDKFYSSIIHHGTVTSNNKYMNNYEYNRTVFLMSSDPTLLDNNFLLLKKDTAYTSPVGMLYYEFYSDLKSLNERLQKDADLLQCIVSADAGVKNALPFGKAQCPGLSDYADGVDTMEFLINL